MSNNTVLVVGGYGVFGSHLSSGLLRRGAFDVLVAGRSQRRAEAFCRSHGGRAMRLDRTAQDLAATVAAVRPAIVIDAAGPFQAYGRHLYALAEAAVACGAHYLDLSDDGAFTAGIASLDTAARARGVTVLSGASSVPALSSAAVEALAPGLEDIHLIESVILPGNRAPRGLSVIKSILTQVGQSIGVRRDGCADTVSGWSGLQRERLQAGVAAPLRHRWSSLIGAPDLVLFPKHYGARSVLFRAGLEVSVMHRGLGLLALLPRIGIFTSLDSLSRPLKTIAEWLAPLGTDRGGMAVRLFGLRSDGVAVRREWTLIAEAGNGPRIPALAAQVLCGKLLEGSLRPGARPCLGEVTLAEAEAAALADDLQVVFARSEVSLPPLFRLALEERFEALPRPVRDLHTVLHERRWSGSAGIERGSTWLAKLVCRLVGFPEAGEGVPVIVTMRRDGDREMWERRFGRRRFRSEMSLAGRPGSGVIYERFGPFRFRIDLTLDERGLHYPVGGARLLGVPLPRCLVPRSDTVESAAEGSASFDVSVSLPWVGKLVRYRGTLTPVKRLTE